MSDYKYPQKHRRVEIFSAKRAKVEREGKSSYVMIKTRRHPKGTKLWAYVRMMQSSEGNPQVNVGEAKYLVVINHRDGIQKGDYVDLGQMLLQVTEPPDVFELKGLEMKLTCVQVERFEEPFKED